MSQRSGADLEKMNISNELLKTSIWKEINDSNEKPKITERKRKDCSTKTIRKSLAKDNEDLDIPLIDQSPPNNKS